MAPASLMQEQGLCTFDMYDNNYDKAAMLDFELKEVRKSGGELIAVGKYKSTEAEASRCLKASESFWSPMESGMPPAAKFEK